MTDQEILDAMSPRDKGILIAYAECGMRPSRTARKHFISHQGVEYHLRRVRANTGLDPRNFFQLYRLVNLIIQERKDYDGEES